ncbi:MAG TPA: hypothetical protein PLD95_02345 [bacterium]|jgi:hypothetical protein|nr:MAG: hypothetical protein BWX59_00825 [Bacteroidetes bacterium ADurb.Bin028]HOG38290.1 hypothetical protein [bacterium]
MEKLIQNFITHREQTIEELAITHPDFVFDLNNLFENQKKVMKKKLKDEFKKGIEDGKIIGQYGSVSYIE